MGNVPKLRFPEFSGEWEEHELGKYLIEFDKKVRRNDDHPILTSSREGLFLQNKYFKQEVISKSSALYRVLPKGYFTYRYMSDDSFFRININELGFDGLVSQEYPVFTTNEELNKEFLKQHFYGSKAFIVFCTIQKRGGTRTRLYFDTLKKYKIIMPTFPEQTKIANFLTLFDKKIEKQSEKVAALEEYKKGLMQKIFSREIRFKDDEGKDYPEWNKLLLGNVCNVITTGKLDANAMKPHGKYRFYTCAKDYFYIDDYAFDDEALLVSGNGANVGYVHYYSGKFNAYQRTYVLTGFSVNVLLLKALLEKHLSKRIRAEVNAGNTPYIRMSTLSEMTIFMPISLEEQTKIANFLTLFDRKIEKEKAKLEALREQKKGLLQQMFV